jgi:hypothetical protein
MNMQVFWDVALCHWARSSLMLDCEDKSTMILQNVRTNSLNNSGTSQRSWNVSSDCVKTSNLHIKLWTIWLARQLPPQSCYCADHSQLSQSLSFIKWGWLFPYFMQCNLTSNMQCILCFQKMSVLELSYFLHFCGYFIFLILLFHMFSQPNCCFELKMILMAVPVQINHIETLLHLLFM